MEVLKMNMIEEFITKQAKELEAYVIEKRRDFHMYPELKYEEKRTSSIVSKELEDLGYEVIRAAKTGVIGILRGKENGKTVALRADMDALSVQEENDVPYKSRVPGKMHACGHDAHTAMLLGAAKILAEIKDKLNGTVKLIFQPGEEGGLGAKKLLKKDT
ncbi:Thermostable carboxypeptidase [Thermococcus barophilus]|uniref:Thermostable carboxypeptidase n=1 Tax=Thermococcus barophilus TaxID=55802 RepID=A0A0S1X8G2_THEBA|nr:Thermostable carboxypeptidase [Thermococcus barophilus]